MFIKKGRTYIFILYKPRVCFFKTNKQTYSNILLSAADQRIAKCVSIKKCIRAHTI